MQECSDNEIRIGLIMTGISLPVIVALILHSDGFYSWLAWIVVCDFVLLCAWFIYVGIVELKWRKENLGD